MDECIDQCAGELVEALLVQEYLFYWYKSADTDAGTRAGLRADVDSHAAARAKGVFCRCLVYLLSSTKVLGLLDFVSMLTSHAAARAQEVFCKCSVYLLYWCKRTGFTSTKVQILTQRVIHTCRHQVCVLPTVAGVRRTYD